jgi:hypothetical protein
MVLREAQEVVVVLFAKSSVVYFEKLENKRILVHLELLLPHQPLSCEQNVVTNTIQRFFIFADMNTSTRWTVLPDYGDKSY